MTPEQIQQLAAEGILLPVEGVDPSTAVREMEALRVGDLVPCRIAAVSPCVNRAEDIEIKDEAHVTFATLCYTRGRESTNPDNLTKWQYAAFLADAEPEDVGRGPYKFRHDYIVVDADSFLTYVEKYMYGAPIWGAFSHEAYDPRGWRDEPRAIVATPDLRIPTPHHEFAFQRYLYANNNFGRFLRLYHSVELLFDYVIFKKIKRLDEDLVGYAEVMKENQRSELERVKSLVREFCPNIDALADAMSQAAEFEAICKSIFQDYSKDGNPLSDTKRWEKFWQMIADGNLNVQQVKSRGFGDDASSSKLLTDIASYWIYRIRCSIAHNRVGEFLITDDHDEFVGRFAVNLMLTVLKQLFANPEFNRLQAV